MKAMVFAAGMGTRLRPLTDNLPKALIEVGGVPMIEHVILHLKAAGVTEFVVNTHYLGNMIADFLQSRNNYGCTIHISNESALLLETGGGLLHARRWLDGNEPFFVHNADIITDLDLKAMYDHHVATHADATLLMADRATSRYLIVDNDHRLHGWINTKTGETKPSGFTYDANAFKQMAFGGIHIISPSIYQSLSTFSTDSAFSIIPYYLSECTRLKFMGYTPATDYKWCDIGKPETLAVANRIFQ
jgi:NDP-sugar pyrophosphorylase family protein